jgi:TRAP-type C4-dicarboxylate transport system substrate-binding protein
MRRSIIHKKRRQSPQGRLIMTIYTQQANILMEDLPEADQQFVVEFIKKLRRNKTTTAETANKKPNQAIKNFLAMINSVEPLADDEFDEILTQGISFRTPEELDLL